MVTDLLIFLPVTLVALLLWVLARRQNLAADPPPAIEDKPLGDEDKPPANAVVVDGSNVMHWGGAPSAKTLTAVLRSLEGAGLAPIVFFDANVGYVLSDKYMNEAALARLTDVSESHICVVHKGSIADEAILGFAQDNGLRVVSNDRYRDWRDRFPDIARKGRAIRGTYREGAVIWRGEL